jgi:2-polyprenyl-6-methoxyphenol hydroxylase-like FAD-dependent oxidoreductase
MTTHPRDGADGRVVIAGAGPVGMIAALLLARWGVPSVLLEAAPSREAIGSKAICFQRDVLDILDRVGVAQAAVDEGVTWYHGRTFYRDHQLFEITFPDIGRSAYPPFINLSQSTLEDLLFAQVEAEPLADVRFDTRVTGLAHDDAGVSVDVSGGAGSATVAGSYLLGCDGAHSAVRKLLGLPFEGHSFAEQFLIADIRAELPFPMERRFYFDPEWNPGRQVLVHPQPHSLWRIDWQVPADFDLDHARASGELDRRIRRITGDAGYEIDWVSVYRFHQRIVPTYRVGRVLLAGDAAHLMSPFGARGLNSGAQDAENAAWKLAFASRGWAGDDLLDSYDVERHAAGVENLRVTGETMRFLAPQDHQQWARRRSLLEQAVDDPDARARVNSGKLAEPFWYLDSPLTTPAGDTDDFPRAAAVARPVVPGVLCPDAPCHLAARPDVRRLRHLFGDGFVVLVNADEAAPDVARVACPVSSHRLRDLADDGGRMLAGVLDLDAGAAMVVRPDGHVAAVVDAGDEAVVAAAIDRACGHRVAV